MFRPGDIVRVVKYSNSYGDWVSSMDNTIGKSGVIRNPSNEYPAVTTWNDNDDYDDMETFYYDSISLELEIDPDRIQLIHKLIEQSNLDV